jgi:hypothetical protein
MNDWANCFCKELMKQEQGELRNTVFANRIVNIANKVVNSANKIIFSPIKL